MGNKKNKSRRSISLAHLPSDPLQAYTIGHSDGFNDSVKPLLTAVVFSLLDTELVTLEELDGFYNKFQRTIEMMHDGQLTMQEINQILKRDYKCTVKIT